jgi:hypothetical protein
MSPSQKFKRGNNGYNNYKRWVPTYNGTLIQETNGYDVKLLVFSSHSYIASKNNYVQMHIYRKQLMVDTAMQQA